MCRKIRNEETTSGRAGPAGASGFTITELMVAVSLMSLIVLALYTMFNQTQRALRANEAQVDISERGRAIVELVAREMESARVSMKQNVTNLWIRLAPNSRSIQDDIPGAGSPPPDGLPPRTNYFDYVYFLAKSDKAWRGVGFNVMVRTNYSTGPDGLPGPEILAPALGAVGTLYRYETRPDERDYQQPTTNLFKRFLQLTPSPTTPPGSWPGSTNFSQVADGVVHFRVLPYDTAGKLFAFWSTNLDSHYKIVRTSTTGATVGYPFSNLPNSLASLANVVLQPVYFNDPRGETISSFRSNALPAYLELELGILEPDALQRYNQLVKDGQPTLARRYLERRMASVQIFRKRIPLKTVAQ